MGDGIQFSLAPVLGAQHHGAFAGTLYQHLQKELYLVAEADAAHGYLTITAQHDGVHHVNAEGQQIL